MIKVRRVKPCPFCGGKFYVKSHHHYPAGNLRTIRINCEGCFLSQVFETTKTLAELPDRAWLRDIKNQLNQRVK